MKPSLSRRVMMFVLPLALAIAGAHLPAQPVRESPEDVRLEEVCAMLRSTVLTLKPAVLRLNQAHGDLARTRHAMDQVVPAAQEAARRLAEANSYCLGQARALRGLVARIEREQPPGDLEMQSQRRLSVITIRTALLRLEKLRERIERLREACATLPMVLEEAAGACGIAIDPTIEPGARWTSRLGAVARQLELARVSSDTR